jgi:hypothetical protein
VSKKEGQKICQRSRIDFNNKNEGKDAGEMSSDDQSGRDLMAYLY